jgi:protocatechuate 3,4-dioxygenase beta subunit
MMKPFLFLIVLACLMAASACAQQPARPNLYTCEGCEAIYEHPFDNLTPRTTIPPDDELGEPLVISGTVYQTDGTTPAPGVIVYAYHTNAEGVYPTRGDEKGWARRHGYPRGWMKTDAEGRYDFRTIKPGSYPNRQTPAHIHLTVKEPEHREYWIDEILFEDDPNLSASVRRDAQNRGGSGIIQLSQDAEGVWHGTRDIILEKHPEN